MMQSPAARYLQNQWEKVYGFVCDSVWRLNLHLHIEMLTPTNLLTLKQQFCNITYFVTGNTVQ